MASAFVRGQFVTRAASYISDDVDGCRVVESREAEFAVAYAGVEMEVPIMFIFIARDGCPSDVRDEVSDEDDDV
jgi:hypothetical protein